ncbi:MAG: HigA family addiction module antitoxin [Nitrosospira sp.]|nr:HigA family addiction module antitoxin [Nitrosospira sp.]MDN5882871.1 HigA family addiction module antitoxin [Nitrosospira sp.]MDN5935079.1 HigA family addiction module antitoxin [Nitrosospira sp.]
MGRSVIHPGEHLAEQLAALDMSAAALGRQLKVPPNRITEILNGQRAITGDTALRLGHFFGTSPQFWLNLQTIHDLRVAEQKTGAVIKALPTLNTRQKKQNSNQPQVA